jgi:type I restriction enzyme S subunit
MNLVTRASLGQPLLKGMPVLLPCKEEQKEIADYLDKKCAAIDTLISKKEQFLTELENYKKSLIYEYVTGKKEVL